MYQPKRQRIALFSQYADGQTTLNAIRNVFTVANESIGLSQEQLEDLIEETLTGYNVCPCDECGQACDASQEALVKAVYLMIRKETAKLPKFADELASRIEQLRNNITHLQSVAAQEVAKNRHLRQSMSATQREQMRLELFGAYDGVTPLIDTNLWHPKASEADIPEDSELAFPEHNLPEISLPDFSSSLSHSPVLPSFSDVSLPNIDLPQINIPTDSDIPESLIRAMSGMDMEISKFDLPSTNLQTPPELPIENENVEINTPEVDSNAFQTSFTLSQAEVREVEALEPIPIGDYPSTEPDTFTDVAEHIDPEMLQVVEQKAAGTFQPEPRPLIAFEKVEFNESIDQLTEEQFPDINLPNSPEYFTIKSPEKRPKIRLAERLQNISNSLKKILEEEQHHV